MKLTKIQKDLKFKQSNSMKIYIDFNTKTEKMLPIVLKNTFLNWWSIVFIAKEWKIYEKESVLPTYIPHKIFDKNYAVIHEIKPVLTLSKPV